MHPAEAAATAHTFAAALVEDLAVGGEDGHHLSRVLRLRVGETVTVADGGGRWRVYRVAATTREGVALAAAGLPQEEEQGPVALAVAFALTKADKPELTVQKLTELGADRIVPVLSARSVPRPGDDRAAVALERWRRVAREAAKQCRRARLPVVEALGPLSALAGHPALVVALRGAPPAQALAPVPAAEVLVVVGPEGGLDAGEVEALRPWARLGLGPHVLRAETAALATAALVRAHLLGACEDRGH